MKIGNRSSIFFSLKWKILVVVLMMLTILGGVLGGITFRQLINQQNYLLESFKNQLSQNLDSAISLAVDSSLIAAEQITLLIDDKNSAPVDISQYQIMLDKRWPDIQLYWELNSMRLIKVDPLVETII